MKKIITVFVTFLLELTLLNSIGYKNDISDSVSKDNKTSTIDLSKLTINPWSRTTATFDNSTNTFKISERWGGFSIPLEYDASEYNFLEIKYNNAKGAVSINVEYSNKESNMTGCVEYKDVAYISLNSEQKSKIVGLWIQSWTDYSEFPIESLTFVKEKPVIPPIIDKKEGKFNSNISSIELSKQMGTGVNLINTLDAYPYWIKNQNELGLASEICWNSNSFTNKEIINYPKSKGFKTIRITTTWYNHIIDNKYTIDPEWMMRVKQIVDWAIEDGYYVILNEHHSIRGNMSSPLQYGEGYIVRNNPTDIAESKKFLKAIWTQIAAAFNGSYDEHLIFETMNEPRNTDEKEEHNSYPDRAVSFCYECKADIKIVNEYNQLCLDTIRASGGNNAKRFVIIPGIFTYLGSVLLDDFILPEDTAEDKLMITVHDYAVKKRLNETLYNGLSGKRYLKETYKKLYNKYVKKNIPVVIGETFLDSSLENVLEWIEFYSKLSSSYGMPLLCCSNLLDKNNIIYNTQFTNTMVNNWKCE